MSVTVRDYASHDSMTGTLRERLSLKDHSLGDIVHTIPRVPITPSDTGLPFEFQRIHLPISLAFAITINKSQGQSLERIRIYAPTPLFTHGQLYVMLSRARTGPGRIAVLDRKVNNVIYKEVFANLR